MGLVEINKQAYRNRFKITCLSGAMALSLYFVSWDQKIATEIEKSRYTESKFLGSVDDINNGLFSKYYKHYPRLVLGGTSATASNSTIALPAVSAA